MAAIPATYSAGMGASRLARALSDLREGIAAYPAWGLLGWQDIKQRYRRSVIGPFWFTISTGVFVAALGALYGGLLHQPLDTYIPYIGVGMVAWGMISSMANEACTVFTGSEQMIRQVRAPLTLHVCRMVWRNLLIFFHNALILVVLLLYFWKGLHWQLLTVPLSIAVYAATGVWSGLLLGIFCARFRDIAPIVANLLQVLFFATPIMWRPDMLKARGLAWIGEFNPLHHLITILRAPLIGDPFPVLSWLVVLVITAVGFLLALWALRRYRHRVPYWL